MEQYAEDSWNQNSSHSQLNNSTTEQLLWTETGGKVGERRRD